jgi:hypothetical protein
VRFNGMPGMSDICGILPNGRALFVECKTASGRLTLLQSAFLVMVRGQGAVGIVVRDVKDLEKALSA